MAHKYSMQLTLVKPDVISNDNYGPNIIKHKRVTYIKNRNQSELQSVLKNNTDILWHVENIPNLLPIKDQL